MPELLEDEDDEEQSAETETEPEESAGSDGGEGGEGEEEAVAEVDMPGEEGDEDAVVEDTESSGGILGKINTKAVIVAATVVVGVLIVLRKLRGGSSTPTRQGRGGAQQPKEGNANAPDGSQSGEQDGSLEDQVTAGDSDPLKQDEQMMDALGLGGSR